MNLFKKVLCALSIFPTLLLNAEDGYRLWLRYEKVNEQILLEEYKNAISGIVIEGNSPTISVAKKELINGINELLGKKIPLLDKVTDGSIVTGTPDNCIQIKNLKIEDKLRPLGEEGFIIFNTKIEQKKAIVIASSSDKGILYGIFRFLSLIQTHKNISNLNIESSPKVKNRILNHWDNLDRTVERGYAGFSLWDWHKLPEYISPRYIDYARANASIGINGTVLTNVNADAYILTAPFLSKVKALAEAARKAGLKF